VHRSLTTIIGLGIVTAIFLAIMSMFYLQQIPTQEDLDRLEDDIRRQHGLYLSAAADIDVTLVRPEEEGARSGLRVVCTLRPDLQRKPTVINVYLTRIADGILAHPEWRGRIAFATIAHAPPHGHLSVTRAGPPVKAQ